MKKTTTKTAAKKPAAKKVTAAEVKEAAKAVESAAETVVKEAAKKVEEVKADVKEAAKKVEEVTADVKEEVVKAAAKAPAKKAVVKEEVYLQCFGKEINKDDLMKTVKEIWTKQMKNKVGDMKSVALYLKPEENKAYYVINGDVTGSIEL